MVAELAQETRATRMRSLIASGYVFVGAMAAACFCLQFVVIPIIDWKWLLSLPDAIPAEEVAVVTIAACTSYFAAMPLSLASRILVGLQRTHIVATSNSIAHVLTVFATVLAWYFGASLVVFVLCFAAQPILSGLINTAIVFTSEGGRFRPDFSVASRKQVSTLLSAGSLFFVLQLCAAAAYQTDAIIVSHFSGLEAAAKLGLTSRLFLFVNSATVLLTGPLWPAFREASLLGDTEWVKKTYYKATTRCLAVSIVLTGILAVFFNPINQLWTGGECKPSILLILSVCIWSNLQVLGRIMAMLLNGLHVIRLQVICSTAMAILNVFLSIWLTRSLGAPGVVIGSIVSYTIVIVVPYLWLLPGLMDSKTHLVPDPPALN
nr:oligosaccharide flippase family protein [Roseiconus nitratireducens]